MADKSLEDLQNFRKLNSKTPGHPEYGITPGIECSTGPLGQGFATAVGIAMAEANLRTRYNIDKKEVIDFWNENHVFEKSIAKNEGNQEFTFYDGPPTANGKPHIGHILTRVMKDIIPRYQTMKGKHVLRKAGWDTHGLPVELEVEKKLGIDGKDQIESYGLEPFIGHCKESVWNYKKMWEDFSGTVGYWVDNDHPYVTYTNDFIESEWWALKQIWDKGLLYKGFKIVPYCPRCGTPLSSHEVAQGYKDVKEKSAIAKYENGRVVNIKRSTLQKLALALDLRGSDLIIESNPKEAAELDSWYRSKGLR